VRPELIAEVTYLTWTAEGLLRHVVYEGLREDKPARDVRRTG
jgi:bifunctional non-homologous end joining protein LigD